MKQKEYRVTIHVNTFNNLGYHGGEKIYYHVAITSNDERDALAATDNALNMYDLNDGRTLGSFEDLPALNGMLAERFDDPYNVAAFVIAQCDGHWLPEDDDDTE